MKIYLIGVGGVGGFYGGLLAKSGVDITLISRGESFRAIKERGLILNCPEGAFHIHPKVIEHISEIVEPDLVILAVKSYHLDEVSGELAGVVKPRTIVITLQNGLDNDTIVSHHLDCQILPGLVLVASTKTAPNTIIQKGTQRKLVFGPRDGKITPMMQEIEDMMKSAGIEARVSGSIDRELWKKFLFVLSFASATIAGRCSIGEALGNPETLKVYKDVLREAIAVGAEERIRFEPDIFETTLKGALNFDPQTKSSLLVDLENHRQTEVEALHGALVRLAEKHGLPVHATQEIYRQILNR